MGIITGTFAKQDCGLFSVFGETIINICLKTIQDMGETT